MRHLPPLCAIRLYQQLRGSNIHSVTSAKQQCHALPYCLALTCIALAPAQPQRMQRSASTAPSGLIP